MELKIENGDYCPDGKGGMIQLTGADEVLQRVLYRLTARRGKFPLLPEMGSQLRSLLREKPSARNSAAEYWVREALTEESVSVESVALECGEEQTELKVYLLWQGEELDVTVTI